MFSSKRNSKSILLFSLSLFHSNLPFVLWFIFLPPSHIFIIFFDFFFREKNPRQKKLLDRSENNFVFFFSRQWNIKSFHWIRQIRFHGNCFRLFVGLLQSTPLFRLRQLRLVFQNASLTRKLSKFWKSSFETLAYYSHNFFLPWILTFSVIKK